MSHKVRLGPIAVFLTVVAIVLATLAALTTATTNADKVLAERFASITQERYELEAKGESFLKDFDEQAAKGRISAGAMDAKSVDGGYEKIITGDGYTLQIRVTEPDASGKYEVTEWKLKKDWNADNPYKDVWKGGL